MPTKKKRINIIPDNLPAATTPEETCPSVYTGQKLAEKDPERYGRIVQMLGEGKPMSRIAKDEKVSPETISAIAKREQKKCRGCSEPYRWSYQLCFPGLLDEDN